MEVQGSVGDLSAQPIHGCDGFVWAGVREGGLLALVRRDGRGRRWKGRERSAGGSRV